MYQVFFGVFAFNFLAKTDETFYDVKVDAKAAGNNFFGGFGESKHSRTARKRLDFENMWIFRHFLGAQAGQIFWGTFVAIYALLLRCRKCRDLCALGAQKNL